MRHVFCFMSLLLVSVSANAQVVIPGADGSDGPFTPATDVVVDLSLAPTATWDGINPNPGQQLGVYDATKWAVVFRYTEVNIPAGVTVTFMNHPSRAPVVWLVQGDVLIEGTIVLDGEAGHHATELHRFAEPGPGGFRGGRGGEVGVPASGGFGPGGASPGPPSAGGPLAGPGGSYGTFGIATNAGSPGVTYGNEVIVPLIGGSGGAGGDRNSAQYPGADAGAGGGAILVASASRILLQEGASIQANGGAGGVGAHLGGWRPSGGGGSGGAIRLISDEVSGSGLLLAVGGIQTSNNLDRGSGGHGRIRVEANVNSLVHTGNPEYSPASAGSTAQIWPELTAPEVVTVTLETQEIPSDPLAQLVYPGTDVEVLENATALLVIHTKNVPTAPDTATVTVRVVRRAGAVTSYPAQFSHDDAGEQVWNASVDLTGGIVAVQTYVEVP